LELSRTQREPSETNAPQPLQTSPDIARSTYKQGTHGMIEGHRSRWDSVFLSRLPPKCWPQLYIRLAESWTDNTQPDDCAEEARDLEAQELDHALRLYHAD
jgi:hypothetical protein